ncbi:MAG: hypothetical protein COS82_09890 [Zetaproteobacteria bacterium CG06_land_8_20_14_3_00_59_53]|nr:MAG: hypothetical protein COX56_07340 [Zetaproteobacteria bacterium CG23_combo_of_CG06-09_8_20_14_all_59_86]PIU69703.1 MAG: hypothetical protein COS82_09890 [Zetaproteobacteria bacterium CG06_land_8_20_14_3_00_59_53]PIU96950.1 MAG: hypothetical protein COS62_06020 [Zetaproteobacteria bacterium CG03_land_8_20_14_0_80_59_51]PIY47618.1 MAG: hypothetical protein COZ02_01265 [Zetaproteobacteria bacterium CG_4_10_14_0_8_um_filter_59_127]PJC17077.1 MAG: hypothetical protein CO062_08575 [Zetaproteob
MISEREPLRSMDVSEPSIGSESLWPRPNWLLTAAPLIMRTSNRPGMERNCCIIGLEFIEWPLAETLLSMAVLTICTTRRPFWCACSVIMLLRYR